MTIMRSIILPCLTATRLKPSSLKPSSLKPSSLKPSSLKPKHLTLILSTLLLSANLILSTQSQALFNDSVNDTSTAYTTSEPQNSNGADEFLPVDEAYRLSIDSDTQADKIKLNAVWQIAEGYYLYKHGFKISAHNATGEVVSVSPLIPKGKEKQDDYFGKVEVYYHQAQIELALTKIMSEANPLIFTIASQGCADAGLCYPPQKHYFSYYPSQRKLESHGKQNPLANSLRANAQQADTLQSNSSPVETATISAPTSPNSENAGIQQEQPRPLWLIALMAMLGGMVLNLMPCVFPVLTLKVLSFSGKDPKSSHIKLHGLIYTAGVMLSFVGVAALMLGLRASGEAIGWGFQLQNPWFVGALTYLFFIMALSLAGFIELGSNLMGTGQQLASRDGYSGSFFTGVLAVIVASPCTAPFMGTALGYAITQPAYVALAIFAALGFGMALPFLLISLVPALAALMPSPGAWMDSVKRLLAFPLLATCIWLAWVVGNQTSVNGMALLILGCLAIALALWLWKEPVSKTRWLWSKKILAAALALSAVFILLSPHLNSTTRKHQSSTHDWTPYSAETLQSLRDNKKAVFLNVTADWCLTCLANERVTLSQDAVIKAFADNHVSYLKADWTNYDANITALLSQHQRSGIPLYVFYPADGSKESILPQILNADLVIKTLSQ
jgi:thiol:disulfide interchange protein DsbD